MTKARFSIKATIYDKKGKVLTVGENSYSKTHPLQAKFAAKVGLGDKIFLHAELAALARLRSYHKPCKIKVERYGKDGKPALARCCRVCEEAIKAHGIFNIEYTNNGTGLTKETLYL